MKKITILAIMCALSVGYYPAMLAGAEAHEDAVVENLEVADGTSVTDEHKSVVFEENVDDEGEEAGVEGEVDRKPKCGPGGKASADCLQDCKADANSCIKNCGDFCRPYASNADELYLCTSDCSSACDDRLKACVADCVTRP